MNNELSRLIHDVSTPLTMVKLNLEHLSQGSYSANAPKYINRIKSGIDELDYLLAMSSKIKTPIVFRSTVIKEIHKILAIYDTALRQNKIIVRLDFNEDYFLLYAIDKFHRIMINLINNAIDALQGQKYAKLIVISTLRIEDGFVLRFSDNGSGIKREIMPNIFNYKFTTKPSGKGLGLFNVRNLLLENFNGFITCTSEVGRGSEFEIFLPDPR